VPEPTQVVSANIRAARAKARLTQDQAADRAGMQVAVYSRIERGEVDARVSSLSRIAAGLGVTVADLVAGL
jgi:transcriptional regulator with XRE-family HTH domain